MISSMDFQLTIAKRIKQVDLRRRRRGIRREGGGGDVGSRSRESRCWVTGRIVTGIISGQDLGEEALSTRSAGDQQASCPSREASAA